ncbi:GntR family transcriptional regulator [Streptomyces sp. SM12]|uniref:GntR family transcriptional regulator n=1 Tax=Streptomyces sp. SM12 TaxID=1071602 RepID=UPI000CD56725|nr:GntR family transcriptional regulator [Streptomyces sp. SM12]
MAEQPDNRPPVERIAGHYKERIQSNELPVGTLLPSIRRIAQEWGVSTPTVERAMKRLRDEGLVRGIRGVGTEVAPEPVTLSSGAERHDRRSRTYSSWGTGETSSDHAAAIVPAPADVAAALGIDTGDDALRRSRVYRDEHGIVAHSTSWIPVELARAVPRLKQSTRLGRLSLDLIAEATGRHVVTRADEETARIATATDLKLLELPASTVAAILVLTARFEDADGDPLEFGVDLGAPGRVRRSSSEVR